MELFSWYGYVAWIPLVFWVALFNWFWRYSNPLFLRKMVKKREKWAVLPDFASKDRSFYARTRLKCVLFSFAVSAISSYSVAWLFKALDLADPLYGFASVAVFLLVAVLLYRVAMRKVAEIYQSAYFYEYRRVRYESERKGAFQNEGDVHNRTIWSFTKKLRNAEAHRRLWKYVNAMAKTKKIPRDVYAETMYV